MQLYHDLFGVRGFCINGRQFLGNTPTVVAGPNSLMRFGVVSMGSDFHTFHLHGHRWILPGPHGTTPTAQQFSPMDTPVSQFEDTRGIGPANSLVFTIDGRSGSFMRAGGAAPNAPIGEWHMHCHVLNHMMQGMMGSLLIVAGGADALPLPVGHPMVTFDDGSGPVKTNTVHLTAVSTFSPKDIEVKVGTMVTWIWDDADGHTVTSDTSGQPGPGDWTSAFISGPPGATFTHTFTTVGTFPYHCQAHGAPGGIGMAGTVKVVDPAAPATGAQGTAGMSGSMKM